MDIDIDFSDRSKILAIIPHHLAMRREKDKSLKHNTGIYVQQIPHDPFTNISTIEYQEAEDRGYFKIDFLNVSLYEGVRDEQHLNELLSQEPLWELLHHEEIVEKLFHISGHFNIIKKLRPASVEQLAAVLAIIRPAKRYLLGKDWNTIAEEVWKKPDNDELYYFKKSHAVAYALGIVVQLNLICEQVSETYY